MLSKERVEMLLQVPVTSVRPVTEQDRERVRQFIRTELANAYELQPHSEIIITAETEQTISYSVVLIKRNATTALHDSFFLTVAK